MIQPTNYNSFAPYSEIEPTTWRERHSGTEAEGTVLVNDLGLVTVALVANGVRVGCQRDCCVWFPEESIDIGKGRLMTEAQVGYWGERAIIVSNSGRGTAEVDRINASIQTRSLPLPGRERATTTLAATISSRHIGVDFGVRIDWPPRYGWTAAMGLLVATLDPAGGVIGNVQVPKNYCEELVFFSKRRQPRGWVEYLGISKETIPNRSEKDGWYWAKKDNEIPDDQADLQANLMRELAELLGMESWGQPIDPEATAINAFQRLNEPNPLTDIVFRTDSQAPA